MIEEYMLTAPDHVIKRFSNARRRKGGLREEVAALSRGDPTVYDAYMDRTREEMWVIAIGGAE